MNRFRAYFPSDDAPTTDGDAEFRGVDARTHPAAVGQGMVSHAVNQRFDSKAVATRKGIPLMGWGAAAAPGSDPGIILPYGSVRVAASFSDPVSAVEWIIIVTANGVWKSRPGTTGTFVPIASGQSTAEATDLIQTFNGMVMLRGPTLAPLRMETVDGGFQPLPAADSGKESIPVASSGIYFQNRLFVVDSRTDGQHVDSVWVSDFGGAASVLQGDPIYNSFRINQGSADRLTGLAKFNDTTLVAFKDRSVYVVSDIYGDNESVANNARLNEVTRQYGCIAPHSVVQVGADLWFLGNRRGVCSIRQTETNALQGVDVPVSRDIQPIIDRINWEYSSGVVAAVHDNHVYFAVPLDDSTTNNAVLVYSTLNQAWAGYDYGAAVKVRNWVKFNYGGAIRLGFLSTDGFISLYEDGYHDHTADSSGNVTYHEIAGQVRSRGYGGALQGLKRFSLVTAKVQTFNPAYTITARQDGVNETKLVATITKDRTKYLRPHGKPDWDPGNAAGDWEDPFREDYSVIPGGVTVTDVDDQGTVAFDVLQEWEESRRLIGQGNFMQIEIATSQGRVELTGLSVDTRRGQSRQGNTV